ncbi:MAG: Type secretion system protein, partial [Verrucomicrobiaceae bacterium]|nr:Type secretion system protein [Verrucomicrobiaceae bacterium]
PPPVVVVDASANQSVDTSANDNELVEVVFQGVPLPQILLKYEEWTGKKVIRDQNVEQVNFTIDTTGALPKSKAIEFVERSLLLNGYGFIPAGDDFVKILNLAAIKPGAEHPFIMKEEELPQNGEAIITYIEPLKYLEPDDLKKTLSELVQLHAYGVVTALPNARGVAITENSNTIRYIIELLKTLDTAPVHTEQRSFQLQRASADDVAKALADILDLEGKGSGGSSGGGKKSSGGGGNAPSPVPNPVPGQPNGQANAARSTGVYGSAPQASSTPPKLVPIPRTNKLLVIARASDLDYIATLIDELDGAAEIRSFITRPLKYLAATEILPIIKDAITRGEDEGGGGGSSSGGSSGGKNTNQGSTNKTGDFGSNRNSGGTNGFGSTGSATGNSGFGGGGAGGAGGGSGGGGLQALRQGTVPQSLVVGKSLLIADPVANTIFASGPPEHLRVLGELLDELDKRPRSVMLSVVIGQLKLDDNKDFGIDYIFRPNQIKAGGINANVAGTSQNRVGVAQSILDPNAVTGLSDLTKALPSGIQLFGTINDQVTFALSALAQNSNFKILSRPTLYTMNNQPASIETGLKIPVPVSSLSSFDTTGTNSGGVSNGFVSNIQYQDVSLRLDVSPLINSDDELTLQVKQVNADVAGSTTLNGNSIPNISNQGLETTIMVKNNATVLLGGLIQETTDKERSGIPILKDIPLIKYLASSTKDNKTRRELLVFIQPRIVKGEGDQPVSPMDSAGASPLGDDARKFMTQERSDPAVDTKTVHRNKVSTLLHKLFE